VLARELALAPAHLLAEVAAAAREPLLERALDVEHRAALAAHDRRAEQCRPALLRGQLLGEQDVAAEAAVAERPRERARHHGHVLGRADGPQPVAGAVADEAQQAGRPLAREVGGHDAHHVARLVAHREGPQLPARAEVTPPGRDPVGRREQVAAALGEPGEVAGDVVEAGHRLEQRRRRGAPAVAQCAGDPVEVLDAQLLVDRQADGRGAAALGPGEAAADARMRVRPDVERLHAQLCAARQEPLLVARLDGENER
jgi:hypothetical protein